MVDSSREFRAGPALVCAALLVAAGCAKGVQDELQEKASDVTQMMPAGGDGMQAGTPTDDGAPMTGDDGAAGMMAAAGDATPCTQGVPEVCTCAAGGEGERDCIFDPSSPLDGFYSECRRCVAPMDGAAGAGMDDGDACGDGMKNGFETGTDCGGPDCDACGLGGGCLTVDDCSEGECEQGVCTMPMPMTMEPPAAGSGGSGAAGSGGMSAPPPDPTPPPPSNDCRTDSSLCSGLECCKNDGTCGLNIFIGCI